MAEPLTNVQEPGFYSRVKESPSLFLAPATVGVIGLVGEGKSTKSITSSQVKSALMADAVGAPVVGSANVYSPGVFKYPASSYGFALLGAESPAGLGLLGLTLKLTVEGGVEQTLAFAADPADMAALITAVEAGLDGVKALDNGGALMLVAEDGLSFVMGDGTANVELGFTAGDYANMIWWDSAIVDAELAPQAGTAYSIDLETPKVAADYAVKYYTSATQVYAEFGDPIDGNGLSVGAYSAFNAPGATVLAIRQLNPANFTDTATKRAEIGQALRDMEAAEIDVLVPMIPVSADPLTIPLYLQHVSKMSSKLERKERIAILGVDERAGKLPLTGANSWESLMANFDVASSSGLEPKRIIMMAPGVANALLRNTAETLDGTYLAASFAGRIVAAEFDTATPMTRKTLALVESLDAPERLRNEKNQLTAMGVTIVEMKGGVAVIRRAMTADTSSIASQEPSIVRAFDQIASELREFLEKRFVGSKILPNVTSTILEAATQSYLNGKVAEEIIGGFRSIKATPNASEPRQFDISFEAVPVFPFLWGFIDISISIE